MGVRRQDLNRRIGARLVLGALLLALFGTAHSKPPQAPAEYKTAGQKNSPKHGLTGSYYLSNLETHSDTKPWGNYFVQVWIDDSDFALPRTFGAPAATRVDAQIAFGEGKGFSKAGESARTSWGPTEYTNLAGWNSNNKPESIAAVIWKGYIHFPTAGTYYFATLSRGASAVYLNSARVVLNGKWAGGIPSDAFSYSDGDIADYIQNVSSGRKDLAFGARPNETYIVPVPIEKPRDLPIEVQYQAWAHDHQGIDLFWVTPDAPKDSAGKPIAQIVPADVLYTDPPSTSETPVVRKANSTVSADFMYFPTESIEGWVTVKVRLADKDGKPVAGKQVYISSVTSFGGPDTIVQPEKPTDENGIATAKLRGNKDYSVTHESQIFATDVTDLVDSAQVAHVSFRTPPANPFFPDAFSPYYDPNMPLIEPLPLQVGRQVTIKMPLVNRSKFAADLTTVFESSDANIGAVGWHEIGRVKNVRLQPGEHKDVSITWTPETTSPHVCFRVSVNAKMVADARSFTPWLPAMLMFRSVWTQRDAIELLDGGGPVSQASNASAGSMQHNAGQVQAPPCGAVQWGNEQFPPTIPTHPEACTPNNAEKTYCQSMLKQKEQQVASFERQEAQALSAGNTHDAAIDVSTIYILQQQEQALNKCATDPADLLYERLAVASADAPDAYMEAVTKSWERYQGAESRGDNEWMSRQLTAARLYMKCYSDALRRNADDDQKRALSLPTEDPGALATAQHATDEFVDRWRQGQRFTADEIRVMNQANIPKEQATAAMDAVAASKEQSGGRSLRTLLLAMAAQDQHAADEAEQLANRPANIGEDGKNGQPLSQTYLVGNPHDKEETVQLLIRPISVPADWKLSIVNAEQIEQPKEPGAAVPTPKYPVQASMEPLHYAVKLPAKAETRVASVLVPVGEVGANTTARWAVEGRIGDELLGGMVHEMNVPYLIADLKLPPVGSKEEDSEQVPSGRFGKNVWTMAGGALVVLEAVFLIVFFVRRRKQEEKPAV